MEQAPIVSTAAIHLMTWEWENDGKELNCS